MLETTVAFDDGAAYDRFMGRWTRALGSAFLDWLAPPPGARWLDIGCGSGAFTQLLFDKRPAEVTAVDPSVAQIEYARRQPIAQRATFRVADAQQLPFADGAFDIVVSALVINFVPDRLGALKEMCRTCRPAGTIAGYVWDLAGERAPMWPLVRAFRQLGIEPPRIPGADATSPDSLATLFSRSGLSQVVVKPIEVAVTFPDFDDYWRSQTPAFSPQGKAIAALSSFDHARLTEDVRALLGISFDGTVTIPARANAIKARVPF